MTTYIVHLYREMRLSYTGIEADTPEAAAAIAGGMPTSEADNIEDCEGQNLAALVDTAGDEDYSQSETIDFEAERIRKAAPALLSACRMVVARWEKGDLSESARACYAAVDLATDGGLPCYSPPAAPTAAIPYSVLLLYPDYANDSGWETFYAFVEASDPLEAVSLAQRIAAAAQEDIEIEPDDFMPLLVTHGQNASHPLFNK